MDFAAATFFVLEHANLGHLAGFHNGFEVAARGSEELETAVPILDQLL